MLYGVGKGYLDVAVREISAQPVILHNCRDVLFGGIAPEPAEDHLEELRMRMKKEKLDIGVSTDGDADRFGIIDSDGTFITPNQVLPLLLHHLVETRKWKGITARSVMTSHFLDAVAKMHGIDVRETPVGFKYIGQSMMENEFIVGGEESGGLTIKGHVPEKDGILACLLMIELRAISKMSFGKILQALYKKVGYFYTHRINLTVPLERIERLREQLTLKPPVKISNFNVKRIIDIDGWKFIFKENNAWLGIRLSGTEPVVRLYVEADSPKAIQALEQAGKTLIMQGKT
jgi:phosphomannomutase